MRPVRIMDTTLRDAHQSLWATRMEIGDMLPILEKMDSAGYWALEVWGGATFDAALRFLDENPWERLRTIKRHCPNTPLQMLLRGQNLVGYHHYSDEICERFIAATKRNGLDNFRVFDALNDIRNVEVCARAIKECGGLFEGAISYTVSPVHTLDGFVEYAQGLKELGADTICIKDMAGMLTPYRTEKMVRALKDEVGLPVHVHCHYIGGMAPMNYLKAVEAGADIIGNGTTTNKSLQSDWVSPDGVNEVYFSQSELDAGTVAVTIVWGVFGGPPSTREIIEWDMVFNDALPESWGDATVHSADWDVLNIATHELGHTAGLGDLYSASTAEQTMYGYASPGEVKKRTLESGDIAGIKALYQ